MSSPNIIVAVEPTDTGTLVVRARAGEREAFAELVRRFHRPVRAYVSRWIRDAHSADDIAQDVFLAAFQQLPSYKGDAEFLTWLLGIARHKSLTSLRAAIRRQQQQQRHLEALLAERRWQTLDSAAGGADSADGELQRQLHAALGDCVENLAPGARELVAAHYFRQESAESIAAELQRKSSSVRMTLLRIRRLLGDCLRTKHGFEEFPS